jgi:hypothetical protein
VKNLIILFALVTVFAFTANAQSKECCSKEKGEKTKLEKSSLDNQTMKSGDKLETTTTELSNGKEIVKKEIVVTKTKMDKKEKCEENASCCSDMKKEKQVEKEIKQEIKK